MVRQCLAWEAESDLRALPCVCVDLSVAVQEAVVHTLTWGGYSMYRASGGQAQTARVSTSQLFGVLSSVRFFPSCLSEEVRCIFLVLPGPGASRSCYRPGESCPGQGQVSPAAVLTPLPTFFSPSGRGSVHLAVLAPSIFDSC